MRSALVAGAVLAAGAAPAAENPAPKHEPIEAISRPSADVIFAYVRPGKIQEVLVEPGEIVTKGQELVKQEDSVELVRLEILKAESLDETRIKAAEAQHQQKKVELERLEKAERPPLEIDRAKLDVTIASLSIDLAKLEHAQDARRYVEALRQWERMTIRSSIDGIVHDDILAKAGQSVDAHQPVIRVIQRDPLWIDVPTPQKVAKTLKMKQITTVKFDDDGSTAVGKITYIAPEQDAASRTLTVRIEVPNPAKRKPGEHVTVAFPANEQPGDK